MRLKKFLRQLFVLVLAAVAAWFAGAALQNGTVLKTHDRVVDAAGSGAAGAEKP